MAQVKKEFMDIPEIHIETFCDSVGTRLPHNRRLVLIYDCHGESDLAETVFHHEMNSKIYHLMGKSNNYYLYDSITLIIY